ncbi:MAG: CAP domain-containing protein [Methanoregula sp.]
MCGAAREFSVQKFCTSCGAPLPDPAPAAMPEVHGAGPASSGMPVRIIAIAVILILGVAAIFLLPHLMAVTGTAFAGTASANNNLPLQQSPSGMPLPGVTTIPATGTTATPVATKTVPSATTTAPITTLTTAQTTRTLPPTPTTTVPTAAPTTVITLETTKVPPQPPVSSYASSTPGAPYLDPAALEVRVHELINNQRQQNGLSTLSFDPFLADIARGHSWDMVIRNYFEHMNPDGLLARDRGVAAGYPCIRVVKGGSYNGISENLYQGTRYASYYSNAAGVITAYNWSTVDEIAERAVTGWMNSSGHRHNILTSRYEFEGIGVAFSSDDKIYVTENFC